MKDYEILIDEKKFDEAAKLLPTLQKTIDLTVKNNLWHANKGDRQKSRYASMLPKTAAKAEAKPAAAKAPAKKPAAKKAE